MTQKIYHVDKFFYNQIFFFLKNTCKVALQYLFNKLILFNIVFNLKLNSKLEIDSKMRTFKNLEETLKTLKKFGKSERQTRYMDVKFVERTLLTQVHSTINFSQNSF